MDADIDEVFERAARAPHGLDRAALDRINSTIHASLRPVRPRPARWVLIIGLLLICSAVAFIGADRLGFFGFHALGIAERAIILSVVGILGGLAARECVGFWTPGSRHHLSPGTLVALSCAALLSVFALLFHAYHAERFLSA